MLTSGPIDCDDHYFRRGDGRLKQERNIVGSPGQRVPKAQCDQHHAEYNRDNDLYLPHRTLQAFELAEFVRHTSDSADVSLLVGDLNLEPGDAGQRLVLANAALNDAWTCRPVRDAFSIAEINLIVLPKKLY